MRPIEKITIHFKGIPRFWWIMIRWFVRIVVVAWILNFGLALISGEEISISWFFYYSKRLFPSLLAIFISGAGILLPLAQAIFRFLQSIKYCRKNNMKLSGFYNQEEADILNAWGNK